MIELVKALAWPVAVVWLVIMLHEPIVELMQTIGQRASKFRIFHFEVELGKLMAASASLSATVEALQQSVVSASESTLRVGPESSYRIAELSQHQAD